MYGYPFSGREMSYVSIDGSFRCSEAESGWTRINLSHGEYEMILTPNLDFQSPGEPQYYLFYEENIIEVFLPDEFEQYQSEQIKRVSHQAPEQERGAEWEAFKTILSGNFTLIEDKEDRQMFQRRYRNNVKDYGECTWRYILLDFNQDGIKDLFIQDDSVVGSDSALLYYSDGKVICAYSDTSDYHDFYVPFKDGRILYIYDYSVTTNEYIEIVNSDFTFTTEKDYLTIRIDHSLYEESYYDRFSSNYDAITGEGEYYFVREYNDVTGLGPEVNMTDKARLEVELMIDELLIPENEWRYCSDSSIKDNNYEEIFNRLKEKTEDYIYDIFYIDFNKDDHYSAFIFVGSGYEVNPDDSFMGALWHVDENSCMLVKDDIVTIEHNPELIESEDTRYLLYTEREDDDSEYTYKWTVKDGKPEDANKNEK
ncbi:MAG: hypothetical protein ACRDBO_19470 [Lachnospiraceae bacterium]